MPEQGGGKRKQEGGAGKPNKKAKYFSWTKDASLPTGTRGFLISCISGKETQASQEALRVIAPYYEALLPATKPPAEVGNKDISRLLETEVADLKDPGKQIFTYKSTGVAGMLYIIMTSQAPGPGPVEIVLAMGEDIRKTRQCKTRLCLRFTPVEATCYASLEDMKRTACKIVAPHFQDLTEPKTFAVQYEHRASAKVDRMDVINAVIDSISQPPHKANLSSPDLTIVVQVVKSSCAMCVIRDFKEFAKFNLRELSNNTEEGATEKNGKQGEASADATEDPSNTDCGKVAEQEEGKKHSAG